MPLTHVVAIVLSCEAACPAPPARIQAMIREADAIWRPLGVEVGRSRAADLLLRVDLIAGVPPAPSGHRLGSIVFDADNAPAPIVTLRVGAIAALVGAARYAGRPLPQWPSSVADAVVGRAMGRVLAHELGHYLLALRTHRPTGLMRPSFDAGLLSHPQRTAFTVADDELPRLRARLAGLGRVLALAENAQ